eukprot:31749-Amphidinium_carterae.1
MAHSKRSAGGLRIPTLRRHHQPTETVCYQQGQSQPHAGLRIGGREGTTTSPGSEYSWSLTRAASTLPMRRGY